MTTFTISRDAFTTTVQADDADSAILAMVRDAGYATIADAAEVCGESEADFIAAQIVEAVADEDDADPCLMARACYFVSADGQGDVLLVDGDAAAGLSDDVVIEMAIVEARDTGLIHDGQGDDEDDAFAYAALTEQDVRDGLHIGEYRI